MRLFLTIVCTLLSISIYGQKETTNWYFGDNVGVSFNHGIPVQLINSSLSTLEGSASISDEDGNLLFYTDGVIVYNRNHQIMENGTNLWGSYSSTQTLIIRRPGTNSTFYLFTVSPQFDTFFGVGSDSVGLHYSIVDMNEDGGYGAITEKNRLLIKSTAEKLGATLHANDKDVWLIAHEWGSNRFLTFLITNSGISSTPLFSPIGSIHNGGRLPEKTTNAIGPLKVSPDGSKIAVVIYEDKRIEILSFNRNSGIVEYLIKQINSNGPDIRYFSGIEFSANSNFLYFSNSLNFCGVNDSGFPGEILQYNLDSNKISNAGYFIGAIFSLQLALDGKIYYTRCNEITIDSNFLGAILNPSKASMPMLDNYAIQLHKQNNTFGLPNFPSYYFLFPDPTIEMPNVFTPNDDEFNPTFKPTLFENMIEAELKIFNRWGQQVFKTKDVVAGWDGENFSEGIYFWFLVYEGKNGKTGTQKGTVQLIR